MKPECRRVLSQIASYSVEELSQDDVDAFTRHVEDCPPCKGQWLLFQKTLVTLSETTEADVSVERSQRMWLTCLQHAHKSGKLNHSENSTEKVEVAPSPFRSSPEREGDRRSLGRNFTRERVVNEQSFVPVGASMLGPLGNTAVPRWAFALAGGAAFLLGASYLWTPSASHPTKQQEKTTQMAALPAMPADSPGLVLFQNPPHATTGMIDYHAAMGFEPFSDHVGPTLVSTTATQP